MLVRLKQGGEPLHRSQTSATSNKHLFQQNSWTNRMNLSHISTNGQLCRHSRQRLNNPPLIKRLGDEISDHLREQGIPGHGVDRLQPGVGLCV